MSEEKLCKICGREYEVKQKYCLVERYGEPVREELVESLICENCAVDMGLDSVFDYER